MAGRSLSAAIGLAICGLPIAGFVPDNPSSQSLTDLLVRSSKVVATAIAGQCAVNPGSPFTKQAKKIDAWNWYGLLIVSETTSLVHQTL